MVAGALISHKDESRTLGKAGYCQPSGFFFFFLHERNNPLTYVVIIVGMDFFNKCSQA